MMRVVAAVREAFAAGVTLQPQNKRNHGRFAAGSMHRIRSWIAPAAAATAAAAATLTLTRDQAHANAGAGA